MDTRFDFNSCLRGSRAYETYLAGKVKFKCFQVDTE